MQVSLRLNDNDVLLDVEPRALLGQVLRDRLGAEGVRLDCETSTCGACTVLLGDQPIKSCGLLAVMADGENVTTVDGVGSDAREAAVVSALADPAVLPCVECRHAMQLVAVALVRSTPRPTPADVSRAISGTVCRCTGYRPIVDAVARACDEVAS
jgi:carbon-monoxide dehydrogenase small subunit